MSMSVESLQTTRFALLSRFIKSGLDKVVAASTLAVLFPVIVGVAIAIYIRMGRPIVFTQLRPGKDGRIFTFYKFRTMTNDCDEKGNLLSDEERLTSFGQFLRKTSLDELPQLWNILKGDMSFVGPRPLLVKYLDLYTPFQARRHEVTPGITGLAQINGRNALSWEEKFKLDVSYVDNWSLWLDLKILFLTVFKVLQQEGINQEGSATAEDFQGEVEVSIQNKVMNL
jgi:lipopolysaccharide/colanic/teichoic acid biosynthesis glycosyltransferase